MDKEKIKNKAVELKNTAKNKISELDINPEKIVYTIGTGVVCIGLVAKGIKSIRSIIPQRQRYTYFDPTTHYSWELKRELNNNDMSNISRMRECGMSYEEALKKLNLIK